MNVRVNIGVFYGWLLLVVSLMACQEEGKVVEVVDEPDQFLVESEEKISLSRDQLKLMVEQTDLIEYQDSIEYGLTLYKITYRTEFRGEPVIASGIVSVPSGEVSFPVLLGGHGTITADQEAPSNANLDQSSGFELLASLGFITVIPDYLGFGSSAGMVHPYYDYLSTAQSSVDMLKATQEFLADSIAYQPELLMMGYSQGGYVALATLKFLEENPDALPDFTLKAVAAGAGGYDLPGTTHLILREANYPSPVYIAFLIYAYHQTNNWEQPLTDFFREPYASQIPGLFEGNTSSGAINSQLPDNLAILLDATFLARVRNENDFQFLSALKENSVYDWAPKTPLRLYHGVYDEVVPVQISENAYQTMQQNGARQVTYFPLDEANSHREGGQLMYKLALPWLITMRSVD